MKSISYLLISLLIILTNISAHHTKQIIRQPAVAGTFYSDDKNELTFTVEHHLKNVNPIPEIEGQIIALIVPHAGLIYSGQIAAFCYKLLEYSQKNRIILCGPSHRHGFDGLSVYGAGVTWTNPIGNVNCNKKICNKLLNYDNKITMLELAHDREHCLEVQLPYLQSALNDFDITPIIMGYPTEENINLMTDALTSLPMNENTIMIASTDWQHYKSASVGWKMDSLGILCLENLDPDQLEKYLNDKQVEMCGGGSTVAVMHAAINKGANSVKILRYGDSGDISGDKSSVVGYVAAVLYKSDKPEKSSYFKSKTKETTEASYALTDEEKDQLLVIARQTIKQYLNDGTYPDFEVSGILKEPGAAFVTLEKNHQLRGCIGHTIAREPLYKTVSICAVQAAVSDPRFPPVTADELDNLHIEISWLTPLQKIESLDEIKVGRDGLMITLGRNRGLLLPQVATDYNWTRTEFLEHTCRKAGLPNNAYKRDDVIIETFQAVIFGEE